jgi:hypothetical protein
VITEWLTKTDYSTWGRNFNGVADIKVKDKIVKAQEFK